MTEAKHQAALIKWTQQPSIRSRYPELKLLFHIKNETAEGAQRVGMDKALGVKKGVPDLCLPVPRGRYHGLYIEMKNESGKTSEAQDWWLGELKQTGHYATVCHGWKEAAAVLVGYLDNGF